MYGAGAAWSRLFLPGAGADPSRSEPPKKVAAPQHCYDYDYDYDCDHDHDHDCDRDRNLS